MQRDSLQLEQCPRLPPHAPQILRYDHVFARELLQRHRLALRNIGILLMDVTKTTVRVFQRPSAVDVRKNHHQRERNACHSKERRAAGMANLERSANISSPCEKHPGAEKQRDARPAFEFPPACCIEPLQVPQLIQVRGKRKDIDPRSMNRRSHLSHLCEIVSSQPIRLGGGKAVRLGTISNENLLGENSEHAQRYQCPRFTRLTPP